MKQSPTASAGLAVITQSSNAKQRVMLLGDSLSFTRSSQGQTLDQAWPVIVKDTLPDLDIWQRSRYGATVLGLRAELRSHAGNLRYFSHFVIQIGIVDCYPRPLPLWLHELLVVSWPGLVAWIRGRYKQLLKVRAKPWISEQRFEDQLRELVRTILEGNPEAHIALIPVAAGVNQLSKMVPSINRNISRYNLILSDLVAESRDFGNIVLLDPYSQMKAEELMLADGMHLSVEGHRAVADVVIAFLGGDSEHGSGKRKAALQSTQGR